MGGEEGQVGMKSGWRGGAGGDEEWVERRVVRTKGWMRWVNKEGVNALKSFGPLQLCPKLHPLIALQQNITAHLNKRVP